MSSQTWSVLQGRLGAGAETKAAESVRTRVDGLDAVLVAGALTRLLLVAERRDGDRGSTQEGKLLSRAPPRPITATVPLSFRRLIRVCSLRYLQVFCVAMQACRSDAFCSAAGCYASQAHVACRHIA